MSLACDQKVHAHIMQAIDRACRQQSGRESEKVRLIDRWIDRLMVDGKRWKVVEDGGEEEDCVRQLTADGQCVAR